MTMDFSGSAGAASDFDILPLGQLAWAHLNVRGHKASAAGGAYIDCELTIAEGQPFAGRKLWEMIGDPFNQGNSEKYRKMGMIAVTRILEAGRGAGPNNMAAYQLTDFSQLDGLKVAIKIGVEEGKDGHDDKNRVAEWLTPNPASQSGHKHFKTLMSGVYNVNANSQGAASPAPSGFGGAPAATGGGQQTGGFGSGASSQPATTGFGTTGSGFSQPPAESAAPTGANGAPIATNLSSQTPADASPSDQVGATPNWLQQAGGASGFGAPAQE